VLILIGAKLRKSDLASTIKGNLLQFNETNQLLPILLDYLLFSSFICFAAQQQPFMVHMINTSTAATKKTRE
jgi:hypothetical protein